VFPVHERERKREREFWVNSPTLDFIKESLCSEQINTSYYIISSHDAPLTTGLTVHLKRKWEYLKEMVTEHSNILEIIFDNVFWKKKKTKKKNKKNKNNHKKNKNNIKKNMNKKNKNKKNKNNAPGADMTNTMRGNQTK